jgi:hypothetical protein
MRIKKMRRMEKIGIKIEKNGEKNEKKNEKNRSKHKKALRNAIIVVKTIPIIIQNLKLQFRAVGRKYTKYADYCIHIVPNSETIQMYFELCTCRLSTMYLYCNC